MALNPADLRRVNVFREATDQDLKLIMERGIERSIEEGGFFFFQGDPARYLYVLTSGRAKLVQISAAGQQVNLRTISPWEMFGALGAVRGAETGYPATAEAIESSTALAIESNFLHEMMQTRPHMATGLMELMTGYIQEMQERYRELATERVQRRIARAVLRLTQQIGEKNAEGRIELAFSRQELAEITGTTLFTVSRTLSEWERLGLVQTGRERVTILDPHGLVRISEDFAK
jgi:CRP-like cAMP-binding protein